RESDGALLARFAAVHDEAAFAEVVRRHAALVLGVCRRQLPQIEDAEDAFQATFLVLARRAGSVRWGGSVGGWLQETACRLAAELRRRDARRRAREKEATRGHTPEGGGLQELCAALDEELRRLPDRFRRPLLLCYLEARTRDQA